MFVCRVLDVGQVAENGRIADTPFTDLVEKSRPKFTFDPATGAYVDGLIQWSFSVVQRASIENSLKAVRILEGPATVVVQYLTIETFENNNFLFVWDTEVRSGTCELVK
jgi:hypothetical protein